jgi:hypothetical protein
MGPPPSEKIHFITYGNDRFKNSKARIKKEAERFGEFDTITVYGPDDIDADFKIRFAKILRKNRGGGFWIWKPYIVNKRFQEIKDGEYLIFIDAGCTINMKGKDRFREYISLLRDSDKGFISFQMSHIEKVWGVVEVFNYFKIGLKSKAANSGQYLVGVLIIKKNKNSSTIIQKWLKTLYDDPWLFTNRYHRSPLNKNRPEFKENRYEQSSLSLLRKIHGSIVLANEVPSGRIVGKRFIAGAEGCSGPKKFPFWATRIRN